MREREIAGLLRDKHPDGMQQLLLHYGPLIRYIIAPIVPDAHDREDCFSEVTLRIWEKADPVSYTHLTLPTTPYV